MVGQGSKALQTGSKTLGHTVPFQPPKACRITSPFNGNNNNIIPQYDPRDKVEAANRSFTPYTMTLTCSWGWYLSSSPSTLASSYSRITTMAQICSLHFCTGPCPPPPPPVLCPRSIFLSVQISFPL